MPKKVFISYSRLDADYLRPLVQMFRVNETDVFLDSDSIPFGNDWELEIRTAIDKCDFLYVYWCHHSGTSEEVKKEYEYALPKQKAVIPVLLDKFPLPHSLEKKNGIPFQERFVGHQEQPLAKSSNQRPRKILLAFFFLVVSFAVAVFTATNMNSGYKENYDGDTPPISKGRIDSTFSNLNQFPSPPIPMSYIDMNSVWNVAWIVAAILLLIFIIRYYLFNGALAKRYGRYYPEIAEEHEISVLFTEILKDIRKRTDPTV